VLKYFFLGSRIEIEMLINEKDKSCDIGHHLNDLNTKLQGQQKYICYMCVGLLQRLIKEMKLHISERVG
jgi:hypothetical protein